MSEISVLNTLKPYVLIPLKNFSTNFLCGMIICSITQTILSPFDAATDKMISSSKKGKNISFIQALFKVYNKEGIKGLYKTNTLRRLIQTSPKPCFSYGLKGMIKPILKETNLFNCNKYPLLLSALDGGLSHMGTYLVFKSLNVYKSKRKNLLKDKGNYNDKNRKIL